MKNFPRDFFAEISRDANRRNSFHVLGRLPKSSVKPLRVRQACGNFPGNFGNFCRTSGKPLQKFCETLTTVDAEMSLQPPQRRPDVNADFASILRKHVRRIESRKHADKLQPSLFFPVLRRRNVVESLTMEFKHFSFTYSVPAPVEAAINAELQKQHAAAAALQKQKLKDDAVIFIANSVIGALSKRLNDRPKQIADLQKQKLEMANNIVDLVAENTALRKRNKDLEQRNAQDSGRILELVGRLNQASKYINS
jgi:hypothetical protein